MRAKLIVSQKIQGKYKNKSIKRDRCLKRTYVSLPARGQRMITVTEGQLCSVIPKRLKLSVSHSGCLETQLPRAFIGPGCRCEDCACGAGSRTPSAGPTEQGPRLHGWTGQEKTVTLDSPKAIASSCLPFPSHRCFFFSPKKMIQLACKHLSFKMQIKFVKCKYLSTNIFENKTALNKYDLVSKSPNHTQVCMSCC